MFRVHFAQAFIAGNGNAFAPGCENTTDCGTRISGLHAKSLAATSPHSRADRRSGSAHAVGYVYRPRSTTQSLEERI